MCVCVLAFVWNTYGFELSLFSPIMDVFSLEGKKKRKAEASAVSLHFCSSYICALTSFQEPSVSWYCLRSYFVFLVFQNYTFAIFQGFWVCNYSVVHNGLFDLCVYPWTVWATDSKLIPKWEVKNKLACPQDFFFFSSFERSNEKKGNLHDTPLILWFLETESL